MLLHTYCLLSLHIITHTYLFVCYLYYFFLLYIDDFFPNDLDFDSFRKTMEENEVGFGSGQQSSSSAYNNTYNNNNNTSNNPSSLGDTYNPTEQTTNSSNNNDNVNARSSIVIPPIPPRVTIREDTGSGSKSKAQNKKGVSAKSGTGKNDDVAGTGIHPYDGDNSEEEGDLDEEVYYIN